tara:strand:+ start:243 stop:1349 length:1107 start_codon:yes stop_codon:yes gene_type:complete
MKKIAIVQRHVTDYRINFYNDLHNKLKNKNYFLKVYAGKTGSNHENKFLNCGIDNLNCGEKVKNISFFNSIYWQNIFFKLQKYDLVICEQANSTLINYPLILWKTISNKSPRFAYWGHGLSLDKQSSKLSTFIKKNLAKKADYWFAYTEHTKSVLIDLNIQEEKITVVNNSIDLKSTHNIIESKKSDFKSTETKNVVVCSRLVKSKRIPFIIEACEIAKRKIKNLKLIIVGDGPENESIRLICKNKNWVEMKGSLFGLNKSKALIEGDIMCLPSHVGLSILDGFSAKLPVLVADFKNHCPEISYFKNNYNGIMTDTNVKSYASKMVYILENNDILKRFSSNAFKTSKKYSHEKMVNNFCNGITKCLQD